MYNCTYKQRPHNYCQGQVTQLGIARSCLSVKIHTVIPSFIYSWFISHMRLRSWLLLFWLFGLKTVAFIAGNKNPATQIFFIHFSIENLIANISFYALSWPELNFGSYDALKSYLSFISMEKTNKKILVCWIFFYLR